MSEEGSKDKLEGEKETEECLTRESPADDEEASVSETVQCIRIDAIPHSPEDPELVTKVSEIEKAESSPKNVSPSSAVGTSPTDGTEVRRREHSSSPDSDVEELNRAARSLDPYGMDSGKFFVMQNYFNQPKMQIFVKPDNRRRHKAGNQPHHSATRDPAEVQHPPEGETEEPLGYVRFCNSPTGPTLMDEVYARNFSPVNQGDGSDAMSSLGISSFKVSSDECSVPSESLPDAVRVSPLLSDSDAQETEQLQERRFDLSDPVDIPGRSSGSQAITVSYPDNLKSVSQLSSLEFRPTVSTCIKPTVLAKRKISKDSSMDNSHRSLSRESSVDLDMYMTDKSSGTIDDDIPSKLNKGSPSADSCQPLIPDLVVDPSGNAQDLSLRFSKTLAASSVHDSPALALTNRAEILDRHSSESPMDLRTEGSESPMDLCAGGSESPMDLCAGGSESPMDLRAGGSEAPMDLRAEGSEAPMDLSAGGSEGSAC